MLRKRIRAKSYHGDRLVRIYLSWFGLAKLILVAKKVRKATFSSIATPHPDIGCVLGVLDEMNTSFKELQPIYLLFLQDIPLELGMSWEPTWKSTPLLDTFVRSFGLKVDDNIDKVASKYAKDNNIFVNLKHELAAFIWNINKIYSIPDGFFSPGILWSKMLYYPFDSNNTRFALDSLEYFKKCVGPYFSSLLGACTRVPLVIGRLAQVIEEGGKRWIFSICNYIKQRLMFPVHKWAMKVLSRIPSDGTFDWELPLHILKKKNSLFFFFSDFKSATNRCPLSVIYSLMSCMLGSTLASSIVNSSLGLNTFLLDKPIVKKMSEIAFLTRQSLGYCGSWSLFLLSHHYIVWLAAKYAYPMRTSPFVDYALLGDDILMTDIKMAEQYRKLLDRLGVTISELKSIIFYNGTIEFAKRLKVIARKPGRTHLLPLEYWIGRGKPLNPYLKGKLVDYLQTELKPKKIRFFPEELVFDGKQEILERIVLLNWVKQWLKWVSWYCTIASSAEVTIDQLMEVPMCSKSWKRSNVDYDLVLFGLIWKCYDMGAGWDITTTLRWLLDPTTSIQFDRWILGGFSGTDFLMAPVDLPLLAKGRRTSEFRGNRTQVKLSRVCFAPLLPGIHCQSLLNLPGPIALLLPSNGKLAHRDGAGTLWKMRE
ncbi:hypothetical protein CQW23_24569 [Capsicum baccatum]|uniref:RNA-dependent RNA polymerase n=1 Tax=Capsicum baccatum TaxID=33114 RepID=A0A2G2VV46_CAPBA|nr:hypothetical protein CQW23_24569 [Capsicum baccatum]